MKNLLKSWNAPRAPHPPILGDDEAQHRLAVFEDIERGHSGWFWATDASGHLTYISPAACERFGVPAEALLGQLFTSLFETDPENPGECSGRPLQFQLGAHARLSDVTVRLMPARCGPGARPAWWALSGQPKLDVAKPGSDGAFHGYRGSARDITTEYQRRIEDSRLAEFDSLTGLANRHRITRRVDQVLAAFKGTMRPATLMMLDLDRFKQVNDTLGHPAGDELLRQVAQRLTRVVGASGEIGRLGGDEFQILLADQEDRGKLGELADKIIGVVSQPYSIDDNHVVIGVSVGMAIAPFDGTEREEIVRAADLALYAAKHGGRGQFRFYSSDLRDEKEERRLLEEALRDAIASVDGADDSWDEPQLAMVYQPVVRTEDHAVVGFEALMRWEHPQRGAIPPSVFIPVAEDTGMILHLGAWGLRQAARDAAAWPHLLRIAVNVSAVQFAHPDFPGVVADVLADTGLDPDRLELELTESVFMGDGEATDAAFKALKLLGVRLALDDFGTGYSSLSYLRAAPFDKLKVDRSFVESCTLSDQNSAKIIAAIIGLADALGMETTVEGVEAFDQRDVVCAKGARLIQGFLYSLPLRQAVVLERMAGGQLIIPPEGPQRHRPERRSVYRRIGVIHEDHRYEALLRNLSATGARIEGLGGVPVGTSLVLDLGAGQLAVVTVSRSEDAIIGAEFETPLVSDGAGGLVTRYRASPSALAAAARMASKSAPQFLEVEIRKRA
ncbi:EAL domain-containing protein [Novosphingobium sp. PASSN1]|uniref:putative bifunctional diguanylate cyclase/phosphodiesterase n=1 Tax=Novosphingobium sp. PASSN1 TaxID=2015561 RepID=UPI000BD3CF63|nr:EAL domain-containing protein [Novosphingobium sp. PASSN1]OYU36083.1 MAG: GGDEF domain-containing protein [Novosphingobium sp. PASSN1]